MGLIITNELIHKVEAPVDRELYTEGLKNTKIEIHKINEKHDLKFQIKMINNFKAPVYLKTKFLDSKAAR